MPEELAWEFGRFLKSRQLKDDIGPRRQIVEFLPLSWVLDLSRWRCSWVFRITTDRDLKHHKMWLTLVRSESMVSIARNVSLSSCRRTKDKKLINSSYRNNGVRLLHIDLRPGQDVKRRNAPVWITGASGWRYQEIRGDLDCQGVELSAKL